jgi:hypothetical protein
VHLCLMFGLVLRRVRATQAPYLLCLQLNGAVGVAALLADHFPLSVVLGRGLPMPCGILLPPNMARTGVGAMAANGMCIVSGVIRGRQPPRWIYTSRIHQTR